MSDSIWVAIAALFCTSFLVRIVPVFVPLRIEPRQQHYLERLLPAAVFINFAVYIGYTEAMGEPVASLALVAGIAFLGRLSLVGTTILGTALYYGLVRQLG